MSTRTIKIGLSEKDKLNMKNEIYDKVSSEVDKGLKVSGTDTANNILAFTENKGIYVATDTGGWYYWKQDVSKYVYGGVYQATEIADGSVMPKKLSEDLQEKIGNINNKLNKQIGKNLFNKNSNEIQDTYFINSNGNANSNAYSTSYYVTGFIEIEPNTTYALTDYQLGGGCIAFYDQNKTFISSLNGGNDLTPAKGIFTTPQNTKYIRLTGNINNKNTNQLEKGNAITIYEEYTEFYPLTKIEDKILKLNTPFSKKINSLISGEYLAFIVPNIKQNKTYSFNTKVIEMGIINIIHGLNNSYASSKITITSTNIFAYDGSGNIKQTLTHGLNIQNDLKVIINCFDRLNYVEGTSLKGEIILISNGVTYKHKIYFEGCSDYVQVFVNSGSFQNCELKFYCKDYEKDIWAFGDSYFDMWTWQANELGFSNYLMDGYSGRGSLSALESLKLNLTKGTPKKILWCMGMNDIDNNNKINSDWLKVVNDLINFCNNQNIELILATIPNTPIRDNTLKNNFIIQSGFRYVDINKSVGADVTTNWYEGLLANDNLHPTNKGYIAIASEVIASVPEIVDN